MVIIVNDKEVDVTEQMSVIQLLQLKGLETLSGMAVAVNEKIVPKDNWNSTCLKERDDVLIVTATAGG